MSHPSPLLSPMFPVQTISSELVRSDVRTPRCMQRRRSWEATRRRPGAGRAPLSLGSSDALRNHKRVRERSSRIVCGCVRHWQEQAMLASRPGYRYSACAESSCVQPRAHIGRPALGITRGFYTSWRRPWSDPDGSFSLQPLSIQLHLTRSRT